MDRLFRQKFLSGIINARMMSYLKAGRKRFYKKAHITAAEDGYLIQLDGKTIKTPLLKKLCIPSEGLAAAVAHEWYSQLTDIEMDTMKLTTICNTAIDNPTNISEEQLIDEMLQFLYTDTICSLVELPEDLVVLQKEKWKPIRDWFSQTYDVEINASTDLFTAFQSDATIAKLKEHLLRMNKWQLNGLQVAIDSIKSFILPMAVFDRRISIEEAISLSRLEIEFQTEKWGNVEYAHDIEKYNQQALLAAGAFVFHMCKDL